MQIINDITSKAKYSALGFCFLWAAVTINPEALCAEGESQSVLWLYPAPTEFDTVKVKLRRPNAILLDLEGGVYIADTGSNRLVKLDKNLKPVKYTAGWGSERDMMYEPRDIASGDGLNIYAADYRNGRIVRFDNKLNFLWDLKLDRLNDAYEFPVSIAVSNWGELFILEESSSEIIRLDQSRTNLGTIGGYKPGASNFARSTRLALSIKGALHIAVPSDSAIITFDRYGNFLGRIPVPTGMSTVECGEGFVWTAGRDGLLCFQDGSGVSLEFIGCQAPSGIIDLSVRGGRLAALVEGSPPVIVYLISKSPARIVW